MSVIYQSTNVIKASGNGIDLAKALALGADVGAMARPFLLKAQEGEAALHRFIEDVLEELRICMFGTGADKVISLRGRAQSGLARQTVPAHGVAPLQERPARIDRRNVLLVDDPQDPFRRQRRCVEADE